MAGAKEENQVVLSYHDSLLRLSDVNLLKGTHWLNDAVIGFYYEYLTQQHEKDGNARFLFTNPSLTQLLRMEESPNYCAFLDSVDAKNYDFVFFPLNNCDSLVSPGGTHWSLLVYSRADQMCYHYDSSNDYINSFIAFEFTTNLIKYFLGQSRNRYKEVITPPQNNGHDCGLHVLCLTDMISRHILRTSKISNCDFGAILEMVQNKRTQLLNLIETIKSTCSVDNE
ncbi:PREDICTED: sentrin-specific protease 8 [Dinoponera quadriceps]|uniref:Sentrin-specific protease 8 n=1 Tax=Dinoponera quadriceps TaxID=609295 RepID=A0A6P3WS62_DINQU|nr:PREDICTED: sentrin-specific protease 8 [Dinoponera quadriceps]